MTYSLAENLPYEYPAPEGVVGSSVEVTKETPKLFHPLKIKNLELPNRIGVSPMCQYTADNFSVTEYHKIHYGSFALRGPGLIIVEATGVSPYSGTSDLDLGIWTDAQACKFKPIVDFAHANTSTIGIQLAHAGRKSMAKPLFEHLEDWDKEKYKAIDIYGPSAVPYRPGGHYPTPKELTIPQIKQIVKEFGIAAKRSVKVGFDFVEIHGAHGYLINEFLSAHSNKRTDEYGGNFEKRIKLLLDIIDEIKANVPKDYPVFLRISGSDLHESNPDAWKIDDSIKLAHIIFDKGIDLLDVSGGGNDSNADRNKSDFGTFVDFAKAIKESVGDKGLVASVAKLNDSKKVNELVEQGAFDLALIGSGFLFNPGLVFQWANELGVTINHARSHWAYRPKYPEMIEYIKSVQIQE